MSASATGWQVSSPCLPRIARGETFPLSYRLSLIVLFAGSGFIPSMNYLNLRWSLGIPGFITDRATLLVCVPAIAIGLLHYRKHGGFARSQAILYAICWIAASLSWVDSTERGRGLICTATLLTTLPLTAFVRATDSYRLSALIFCTSFLCGMLMVQLSAPTNVGRWGDFGVGDQVVMNSNEIGFIAAVVAILMYSNWQLSHLRPKALPTGNGRFLSLVLGSIACAIAAMTVSRSACASLLIAGVGIWVHHARRSLGVIVATPFLLALLAVGISSLGIADRWYDRLSDTDTGTLNGRTEIWDGINAVQRRMGLNCIWGLGVGGIDKQLGEELGGRIHPIDGIQRMHSHNFYLEIGAELGLIGTFFIVRLFITMIGTAISLDRQHRTPWRSLLLLCIAVFGLAGVPNKVSCFPAIGSLILVCLSPVIQPPREIEPALRMRKGML